MKYLDMRHLLSLCLNLKMLFQSCQTAAKSFYLQNSLMGVGVGAATYDGDGSAITRGTPHKPSALSVGADALISPRGEAPENADVRRIRTLIRIRRTGLFRPVVLCRVSEIGPCDHSLCMEAGPLSSQSSFAISSMGLRSKCRRLILLFSAG